MKSPLLIGVSALTLLALSATLFAQTTTGSSLITEMKAAVRSFTLAGELNPGITGLQSAPLVGKRTGDQLSAAEYNRLLELVSQGGGGSGGSGWVDVPVTDTADFDTSCLYRMIATGSVMGGIPTMRYTVGVQAGRLFFGFNLNPGWIGGFIDKGTKATFGTNSDGTFVVSKLEKLCAGSGSESGSSSPSGSLCGILKVQRDGVGSTTCTNIQSWVKCAGQTLSMPASCGATNPCAAMTGCPSGYEPVQTAYSWGGGQTMQPAVYAYHQCSCAKQ